MACLPLRFAVACLPLRFAMVCLPLRFAMVCLPLRFATVCLPLGKGQEKAWPTHVDVQSMTINSLSTKQGLNK